MNADQKMKDLNSDSNGLLHAQLTEKIIRVFYEVYNELGHGFLESVYQAAMMIALEEAGLSVKQQVEIPVWFRGRQVGLFFADLLVEDVVFLELKSQRAIEPANEAQTLNYLRATTIEVALLFNFGPKPEFRARPSTMPERCLANNYPERQRLWSPALIRVHPR